MNCAFLLLLALQPPLGWQLYQSSIAAADGAIRLNETGTAKRWLDATPAGYRRWERGYLHGLSDQSLRVIKAHELPVTGVAVSPGGRRLATLRMDGTIRILDSRRR